MKRLVVAPSILSADFGRLAEEVRALRYASGYLPIADHGVVGDCTTAALVRRDGNVLAVRTALRFGADFLFVARPRARRRLQDCAAGCPRNAPELSRRHAGAADRASHRLRVRAPDRRMHAALGSGPEQARESRAWRAARHPKMVATAAAIARDLSAGDGLLYRYRPDELPDGIEGAEGAFLLCSFWLVDNYARQGRIDEALELYGSLCSRAGPLGLLPEQIEPGTGAFLGNFPQAFSHVGVIASGINLARRAKLPQRALVRLRVA